MRIRTKDGKLDFEAVVQGEHRNRDMAALQRETGWKMATVQEMTELELVAMQLCVFFTWREHGRLISFERAGELMDEVDFVEEPGDAVEHLDGEEPDADPTPALTGSGQGDDADTSAQQ